MEAKKFLQTVGSEVTSDFTKNRSILSFEEYTQLFVQSPARQARNAAQYLRDAIDFYGHEQVPHPTGTIRRFKIFDAPAGDRDGRVAGQEEVQNAIYRLLGNFVRAGRINKLILLHGPNGSAKSTIIEALKRGMEHYSSQPEGALYTFNWIFPSEKLVKGSIGFGDRAGGGGGTGSLASYAHLEAENIEVRITNGLHEHPLFLVPKEERKKLILETLGPKTDFILSSYLLQGELSSKSRRIYDSLLATYEGDWLKVMRHVQVERFYVSRRYQTATATVEPQMSVDAAYQQVTADRTTANLPPALQSVILYDPHGPLVSANRGLIEYSDLLKRPLEAFKYLLGASETGEVPLEHFVLQLDEVLIASSNEKHLAAFKELPDFSSFKGRIELVRVPYLRRWKVEQEIYDAQVNATTVGRHIAPHATRVAAMWAVLTRLKKPISERYPSEVRGLIERLSPLEKLRLYQEGQAPERFSLPQARELKKHLQTVYEESDSYPNYEGRSGASAREIKTSLFNAAQSVEFEGLHPLAVLKELTALCKDKSVYEFLQQEVVEGYHDHEEFVATVEGEYLELVDHEVRDSMGLVSEAQYKDLFEKYVQLVSAWVKGEKIQNKVTGAQEKPDEGRMVEFETIIMPKVEDASEFRKGLISNIGAHKIDNPTGELEWSRIFPDHFKRLRDHFFEERKKLLRRNVENTLKFLSGEQASLMAREQAAVRQMLDTMCQRYGYNDASARDAIVFLIRKRYP
ncbi:MAG: putative serine protein kinase, PrkA [Myxococcaceae bacterium]|nr:putative serine protein kinase, PrkA [Myxococcaceae bacterium]